MGIAPLIGGRGTVAPLKNVADYLAKGDWTHFTAAGTNINDGAMSNAGHTLTCATTTPFTPSDVGKVISVPGAGAAGATLYSTITAFTSPGVVTLADASSALVSAKTISYGTDDTLAVQAAINAAQNAGTAFNQGAIVYFPAGRYYVSGLTITGGGVTLLGCGLGDTASGGIGSMLVGAGTMTSTTDLVTVSGARCCIQQMTLSGNGNGRDVLRLTNTASRFIGEDLYIQNAGVGCGITHGTSVTSLTNKWTNIYVSASGSHGIIVNSSDTEWSNVTTFQNGGDGFRCVGTAGNVINLHTWGNTGAGVNHQSGSNGWRFTNTYSETNTGDGIDLTTAIYNTYVNGVIRANAVGINIQSSSKLNTFDSLQIYNNTAQGVWIQSGDYCTLDGLHCFDDQGSKTQTYAIQIASGVVGTSIVGRIPLASDNLTGGLNDAGTATISNGVITIAKASSQSVTSSNAVANDSDILLAMGAGEVWEIDGILFVDGAQTGDFNIRLNTPSVGSGSWQALGPASSAASTSADSIVPLGQAFNTTQTIGMVGTGLIVPVLVRGLLTVGVTGGTFNLKWAQGTSDVTATVVHDGSFLKFRRLK